jgi:hypothetical protein
METTLRSAARLEDGKGVYAEAERLLQAGEGDAVLADALAGIIDAFLRMGAVDAATKRLDIAGVRRFFTGALGWTPRTVWDEATLDDLAHAYEGYCAATGRAALKDGITKDFLMRMAGLFPDGGEDGNKE